ncbi:hypothetical protein [Lichenifustis flavocetrariae]|uniref:Uncharacterized protein n=1 Tax=Lichenifustis flavocetrariae TaxID=2949735 RepID=A0AA41YY35_9HYPH|nr:hypothetical protein [Lichenifustis flavocetrariae]MCW6509386.1 hypothetical protein [Lichenifustis flavocetrariae]
MIETKVVRAADRSVVVRDDAGHEFTFHCPTKSSGDVKAGHVAMTQDTPEAHDVTVDQYRAAREMALRHAQAMGWLSKD